jgi:hypothetical protein
MAVDIVFENRFWLRIMRDHAMIIKSKTAASHAEGIKTLDQILSETSTLLSAAEKGAKNREFLEQVLRTAMQLRDLKIAILKMHLEVGRKVDVALPPTFINHMLNELDEYIRILQMALGRNIELPTILDVHKLWLTDAAGHAEAIMSELDPVDKSIKLEFKKHKKEFKMLKAKTLEFIEYFEKVNMKFDAINGLKIATVNQTNLFNKMLYELLQLRLTKVALGTIAPLLLDHMLREEAYFLKKLGENVGDLPLRDLILS